MAHEVRIPLCDGFELVAQPSSDPLYPAEIYVGIDKDGAFWQDIAIIRTDSSGQESARTPYEGTRVLLFSTPDSDDAVDAIHIDFRQP